jgi:hypothetical protein
MYEKTHYQLLKIVNTAVGTAIAKVNNLNKLQLRFP